jgi:hypothetical protein
MSPGIRTAGSTDANRLFSKAMQGLLQFSLNRGVAILKLEPVVMGPLILYDQSQTAFCYRTASFVQSIVIDRGPVGGSGR